MLRFVLLLLGCLSLLSLPDSAIAQSSDKINRGAKLWTATCHRCHNRRLPTERTDRQWDVIVSHMRTRANLTRSEVEAIAAFLKTVNGHENPTNENQRPGPDSTATPSNETTSGNQ